MVRNDGQNRLKSFGYDMRSGGTETIHVSVQTDIDRRKENTSKKKQLQLDVIKREREREYKTSEVKKSFFEIILKDYINLMQA